MVENNIAGKLWIIKDKCEKSRKIKHTTSLYKAFKTLRDTCRDAGSCANCPLSRLDKNGDYECIVYKWAKEDDPENWKIEEL